MATTNVNVRTHTQCCEYPRWAIESLRWLGIASYQSALQFRTKIQYSGSMLPADLQIALKAVISLINVTEHCVIVKYTGKTPVIWHNTVLKGQIREKLAAAKTAVAPVAHELAMCHSQEQSYCGNWAPSAHQAAINLGKQTAQFVEMPVVPAEYLPDLIRSYPLEVDHSEWQRLRAAAEHESITASSRRSVRPPDESMRGDSRADYHGSAARSLKRSKKSTERGEGQAKLIAALTKHHKYADDGCLNLEPIGNNELAEAAGVSGSTASKFFNDKFGGHKKYMACCRDSGKLSVALKALNNEFSPFEFYGRRPTGEDDRE